MNLFKLAVLSLASISFLSALSIRPTTLSISKDYQATQVTIINSSKNKTSFDVQVYKWTQNPDGTRNMIKTNNPNLIITPRVVTIEPGQKKKVRIAKFLNSNQIENYRVYISELPDLNREDTNKVKAKVKTIKAFNLPLFVNQKQFNKVKLINNNGEKIRLLNENPGYVKITGITYKDDMGNIASLNGFKYILSGNTADIGLPRKFNPTELRIQYANDNTQVIKLSKH